MVLILILVLIFFFFLVVCVFPSSTQKVFVVLTKRLKNQKGKTESRMRSVCQTLGWRKDSAIY